MNDDQPRGCPDAGVLAAFAEGKLTPTERVEVERHVSACPECPAIVGEVARFLEESAEESEDDPATPRPRWWIIAAAIAAICVPAVVWRNVQARDPLRHIRELAQASSLRPTEGRLERFPHAVYDPTRGDEVQSVSIELLDEAEQLEQKDQTAQVLHARGVVALLSGDVDAALRLLRLASRAAPGDAGIWNDLAAAEIAGATLERNATFDTALRAASRAAELSPKSAAAAFNRGVALDHLGRHDEAIAAFRSALALESSAAWQQEIRDHIGRLEKNR